MKPCIFCPNPRTQKRGEHVWDNWLNKHHGGDVFKLGGTVGELGKDGVLIREYPAKRVDITKDVVCDPCNNGWMSQVTDHAKGTLEGFIWYRREATLVELGIVTVAVFAFMKAAVLDYSAEETRPPFISPSTCHRFRESLQRGSVVFLPNGLQIWMAHYRGERKMEYRFWIDSLSLTIGPYRGYTILLITYVAGAFVFQLTLPKWTKRRKPTVFPVFTQAKVWDVASIPIWPDIDAATWPPPKYLNGASLQDFRERLGIVRFE